MSHRRFVLTLGLLTVATCKRAEPIATGNDAGTNKAPVSTREAVLRGVGECTSVQAKLFATQADTFEQKANALALSPTDEARKEAQNAWTGAIDEWQKLEVMQYGPEAIKTQPGGLDLRGPIYAWPLFNRCLIEQQLVSKVYETGFSSLLVNSRGLGAAEFLLFYGGSDNVCGSTAAINIDGTWSTISAGELASRRAGYINTIATNIPSLAHTLSAAWDPAQGNFVNELAQAGRGSATYKTDQFAFGALNDALFYVESDVKDMKVARPLGIANCENETCPEGIESPFAKRGKQHLVNNLAGFRMVFFGCAANGNSIDELLVAVGASNIANNVKAALDEADAAIAALKSPDLQTALTEENGQFRAVHEALKKLTNILRTEFVTVLDLELPKRIEGDND